MAVKTSTLDKGIGLIAPGGSMIGGKETDDMRSAITDFVSRSYDKLVIDLSAVTYLNSTAIGILVSGHTTYSKKGWHIKLCGINKNIDSVFVVTKLSLVFDVYDTRAEAVASFG